jgi:hypothetical protein
LLFDDDNDPAAIDIEVRLELRRGRGEVASLRSEAAGKGEGGEEERFHDGLAC